MKRTGILVCTAIFMILSLFVPLQAEEEGRRLIFSSFENSTIEVEEGTDIESLSLPETLPVLEEGIEEEFELAVTWNGDLDLNTAGEYTLTAISKDEAYVFATSPVLVVRVLVRENEPEESVEEVVQELIEEKTAEEDSEEEPAEDGTVEEEFEEEPVQEEAIALLGLEPVQGVYEVSDMEQLKEVFALEEKDLSIRFVAGFEISETLVVSEGRKVTLSGTNVTINPSNVRTLFSVEKQGTLHVEDGITFDLSAQNTSVSDSFGTVQISGSSFVNSALNEQKKGVVAVHGCDASLLLEGGVFENNRIRSAWAGVLYIEDQATAVINGGTLRNNEMTNQWSAPVCFYNGNGTINDVLVDHNSTAEISSAGAVLVAAMQPNATGDNFNTVEVVMNGGTLSNNQSNRGGAVYVVGGGVAYSDLWSKATFTLNDGTIQNNTARTIGDIEGAGGGIYVEFGGNVIMNGGVLEYNTAEHGKGGGVATADGFTAYSGKTSYSQAKGEYNGQKYKNWDKFFTAGFVMNGGSIKNNTATSGQFMGDRGCGGGIYIASNNVKLNAGAIENNHADAQGGGVYVGSVPYVLRTTDAVICENHATVLGGGIWLCPTGEAINSVNNGGAIFDNTSDGAGDDLAAVRTNSGAKTTVSDRALGGGQVTWTYDGEIETYSVLGAAREGAARHGSTDEYTPKNYDTAQLALHAEIGFEGKTQAHALAKLIVRGNTSKRGGGIGSNGSIQIGKSYESPIDVTVVKKFEGDKELPKSITIYLLANGSRIDSIELNEENGWSGKWTNLPSIDVKYTVEEEAMEDWTPSVTKKVTMSGDHTFTVTNSPSKKRFTGASVQLLAKKYLDQKEPDRTFEFELLNEEGTVLQTVGNTGSLIKFEALTYTEEGTYVYRVRERAGSDAKIVYDTTVYDVTVTVDEDGAVKVAYAKGGEKVEKIRFDNTSKPDEPKPTPIPPAPTPTPTPSTPPYTPKTGRPFTPNTSDPLVGYLVVFAASLACLVLVGRKTK